MPKFSRTNKQREAFVRSLASSLILNGRIVTTRTRAKAAQVFTDKLITKAKIGNIATTRLLVGRVGIKPTQKLVKEIAPALADRKGGYTRIINMPARKSDSALMAIVEIIK